MSYPHPEGGTLPWSWRPAVARLRQTAGRRRDRQVGALWARRPWRELLLVTLLLVGPWAQGGDVVADVEHVLRAIRQDAPVPALDYLHASHPINADCAYYQGQYGGIAIKVETHPNSKRVASILLEIPGGDQTSLILPAVARVIGQPHSREPKQSLYGWDWPNFRTASLHYAAGPNGHDGMTVVSIFYR